MRHRFQPTATARFWVYVNGSPVKLSLRPGQRATHYRFDRTDEGFSSEGNVWTHDLDEGGVVCTYDTDGRDCDGRMSHHHESISRLDMLDQGYRSDDEPEVVYPKWTELSAHQRDYSAEAAGY